MKCHATGCFRTPEPDMWTCKFHWYMIPVKTRIRLWITFKPGESDDKRPTKAYCEAAKAAVIAIAKEERIKPDTKLYDFYLCDRMVT